jgi:hypothetical protein
MSKSKKNLATYEARLYVTNKAGQICGYYLWFSYTMFEFVDLGIRGQVMASKMTLISPDMTMLNCVFEPIKSVVVTDHESLLNSDDAKYLKRKPFFAIRDHKSERRHSLAYWKKENEMRNRRMS